MLNEKELIRTITSLAGQLDAAVAERDDRTKWWNDERAKNDDLNATIKAQNAEIVRLNEELQTVRENTTCIDGLKAAETEASHEES